MNNKSNNVPALEGAIRILAALAEDPGDATSLGLARRLKLSQSTCYRILKTLEEADWIRPDEGGGYRFSLGLLPYVKPLVGIERTVSTLEPVLRELARETGLTAKCSIRQGAEQVTLTRIESPRPLAVSSPVGARYPVVLGASGACLLSRHDARALSLLVCQADREQLWGHETEDDLRRRLVACHRDGLCENIGRHPQGIDTLSAPLYVEGDVYALTLVGLRGDFEPRRRNVLRRALLDAVKAVGEMADST